MKNHTWLKKNQSFIFNVISGTVYHDSVTKKNTKLCRQNVHQEQPKKKNNSHLRFLFSWFCWSFPWLGYKQVVFLLTEPRPGNKENKHLSMRKFWPQFRIHNRNQLLPSPLKTDSSSSAEQQWLQQQQRQHQQLCLSRTDWLIDWLIPASPNFMGYFFLQEQYKRD